MFDHIPQDEAKGIFFHHLVESSFVRGGELRREKKSIRRIFSQDPYPSHPKHHLGGGGIFQRNGLDRFHLSGEVLDLLLKGSNLLENLL